MPIIENFSLLSEEEQRQFASTIIEKLNAEKTFIDDLTFKVDLVESSDVTGGLIIAVDPEVLCIARSATWECADEDDTSPYDNSDISYDYSLMDDVKDAFKAQSVIIDGYRVSLEISDYEEQEMVDYNVESVSEEDSGIGSYEYFGFEGYDSHKYYEAEGTIYNDCEVSCYFVVEAE